MGRSKSIDDKIKDDAKFREFMNKLSEEAKVEEDRIAGQIDAIAKKQYEGNGWDYGRLFGNRQSDYQNYSDWSLTRINNIIDSLGKALSGGDFPSTALPGSEDASKSTVDAAKDFLGVFGGDYSLIIARVQALISGVLSQFAVASDASRKTALKDMPLSGGLHLFFGSSGMVYTNNTFFTNQFIGTFQIVFEVYMSVDEARAIGLQQILKTTSKELDILNQLIIDLREEQAKSLKKILKEKPEDYASTYATYKVALDLVKLDRDELMQQYNKYDQVVKAVESLLPKLNLAEFTNETETEEALSLTLLFDDWELGIAKRYISEKINNAQATEVA
ncbi:hypothetical protein GCM10028807_38530 [Spirosoma daeguense]